jgi:hypothetical protein
MDSGANISITGDLSSLVNVVNIPPMPITVAVTGAAALDDDCCTKRGYTPLTLKDGSIYWQFCLYCATAFETIISPQAILASSDVFVSWMQTGYKDNRPGTIRFNSADGFLAMLLTLKCHNGLYYCPTNIYTVNQSSTPTTHISPSITCVAMAIPPSTQIHPSWYTPVTKSKQLESKLWLLCLGSPRVTQLDLIPGNTTGTPAEFAYHPFHFIGFKEQAWICCQAAQQSAVCITKQKQQFYMDYGFVRSFASDFSRANKSKVCVVFSHDGFSSYLQVVDEASWYIWVFLTRTKDPPLDIISEFLQQNGHVDGGCIHTNQGEELAWSRALQDMVLCDHHYTLDPTSSDSPSQNSAVEVYNDKFGIKTRTLLYRSNLPAKYWSSALTHLSRTKQSSNQNLLY